MKEIPKAYLRKILKEALQEDLGRRGDVTTENLFEKNLMLRAEIIAKESGVLCGVHLLRQLAKLVSSRLKITTSFRDGLKVKKGQTVFRLYGPLKEILKMERTALNFLGKLSGIASLTAQYVTKTKGTRAKILDTRKTTPTLRFLEKYAVRCGGGMNHRFGLFDQVLIKDNHFQGLKKIGKSLNGIRKKVGRRMKIEVEVEKLSKLKNVILAQPDIILLDNMSVSGLKKAVQLTKKICEKEKIKKPLLEASGGITIKNIGTVARSGVDRISIGALTHSAPNMDFSLEIV